MKYFSNTQEQVVFIAIATLIALSSVSVKGFAEDTEWGAIGLFGEGFPEITFEKSDAAMSYSRAGPSLPLLMFN